MNLDHVVEKFEKIDFFTKQLIIQRLLTAMQYGEVELQGRYTKKHRSRHGGHELVCHWHIGGRQVSMVVKIVEDSVHLRMICELAATAILRQASFSMLIATKKASRKMKIYAEQLSAFNVNIVDGSRLAELLHCYSIGVRENGELDYAYIQYLEDNGERIIQALKGLPK